MSDAQIRLGVVCGKTDMAHRFFSNGPYMTVKFVSDMKRHPDEHGFKATYQFIKKGRTGEIQFFLMIRTLYKPTSIRISAKDTTEFIRKRYHEDIQRYPSDIALISV